MKRLTLIMAAVLALSLSVFGKDIKGRILDVKGNPLEFANVVLLQDSAFITGVITNNNGEFNLSSDLTTGLKLKLSFVGFDSKYIDISQDGELGNIKMMASSNQLEEVVVKGKATKTYLKGNSLITNVENSVLANAGSAKDVLRQVPMVIENNGNLEIFGKGSPTIYINGRKITDSQELSTLLSGNIRNVEVITNPSASYSAEAKAVIRIRTKRPQGEGWSATLRSTNGAQHNFQSANMINLKYRAGGFEVFSNFTYNTGKNWEKKSTEMTTFAKSMWDQQLSTVNTKHYKGFLGKVGFTWVINNNHSIGAYYQNEYAKNENYSHLISNVQENNEFYDKWETRADNIIKNTPRHATNVYYNGQIKKLNIDFNADYIWNKRVQNTTNDEISQMMEKQNITTYSKNKSKMLAEKLMMTYPIGKGVVKFGEEYTSSRTNNHFNTEYVNLDNTASMIKEDNAACFMEIIQQLGMLSIGAGLRYEYVKYDYFEDTNSKNNLSRTYHNIFPSFNAATRLGDVQMSLSYSCRVERPTYSNLNANVSYMNRMTYESGNPRLQPTKLYNLEYMAAWKNYFAQVSYSYFDNPIVNTTKPYSDDGKITILTYENFKQKHFLQAFMGSQFKFGAWQPRINVGMFTQWFDIPVNGKDKSMNKPIGILQWQNAIHLPIDIWLNIDCQWTTSGNDRNIYVSSSSYVNAKLYKDFYKKKLSFTLEARDVLNNSRQNFTLYNNAVTVFQKNFSDMRCVMFTLQYNFNVSRERYRGTGAGNTEKKRF
ncbi:TonB-dependent receptor domain-containing protein [Prevotella sp.]|uniref:TonB-dependent receptor domain-containing protein n=1 Tax=Prevotella sp. TaxID=59823 RepID=UPI003DA68CF7